MALMANFLLFSGNHLKDYNLHPTACSIRNPRSMVGFSVSQVIAASGQSS